MTDKEIAGFLELSIKQIVAMKRDLIQKMEVKSLTEVIRKSFHLEIVNPNDYVPDLIKMESEKFAHELYLISLNMNRSKHTLGFITAYFKVYYEKCKLRLKNNSQTPNLNTREMEYLRLKYKMLSDIEIAGRIKCKRSELIKIRRVLLRKVGANNLYNAFRIAFNSQLLLRKNLELYFKNNLKRHVSRVINALEDVTYTEKERKLLIYNILIEFYNSIEYRHLLMGFPKPETQSIIKAKINAA